VISAFAAMLAAPAARKEIRPTALPHNKLAYLDHRGLLRLPSVRWQDGDDRHFTCATALQGKGYY
jgi:hypothetical protein